MREILTIIIAMAGLCSLVCCKGGDKPVPRQEAYPRVAEYDSAYAAIENLPVRVEANLHAQTSVDRRDDGTYWIDIAYPEYKAQIYCTLIPVTADNEEEVVNNRFERMALNLAGREPEERVISNGIYSGLVLYEPSAVNTPVQCVGMPLEIGTGGWAVAASAFFFDARPGAPLDSLRPMSEILLRDIEHMIKRLQ